MQKYRKRYILVEEREWFVTSKCKKKLKIIKSLEVSNILINEISKTAENGKNKQKGDDLRRGGFLSKCVVRDFRGVIVGNLLLGNELTRATEGAIETVDEIYDIN